MCLMREKDIARARDIDHVKILGKAVSYMRNESRGLWKDGELYRFEPIQAGREYISITVKIGEDWQWQQ
jgi:hypothetical protein